MATPTPGDTTPRSQRSQSLQRAVSPTKRELAEAEERFRNEQRRSQSQPNIKVALKH